MPNIGLIDANLILCESVLTEITGAISAVRIMDALKLNPHSTFARFFILTYLHSHVLDFAPHVLKVRMVGTDGRGNWISVADAPEHRFIYGYKISRSAPGGFLLTTEFNLDLTLLGDGTYYVEALVDVVA